MNQAIQSIVIVGGGSAGWITAAVLASQHNAKDPEGIRVTLVESSDIPTIGVGEGTWPTMRSTLKKIGLRESDFLVQCNAAFKQGSKFVNWCDGAAGDFYYHPFSPPRGGAKLDLAPYWAQHDPATRLPFAAAVDVQQQLCESGHGPKNMTTPEYQAIANYGYHLDAGKFAELLKHHCRDNLGVRHVVDNVSGVRQSENGDIAAVNTEANGELEGDLFIDCTGFAALLIGKTLGVDFEEKGSVLFADTALAMQVPYAEEDSPIACQTISTGQAAGWIWDIGLTNRRGTGYVYSSQYTDDDTAEQTLRDYVGSAAKDLNTRKIPIRSGHRQQFWKNNCVAVGLSAGFLEPLEASALMLIELSAAMISERLPANRDVMNITARQFNEVFSYRWERIIEFLKLHYVLSRRTEPFWQDNSRADTIPESLQEKLRLWRYHAPAAVDFSSNNEVFSWASYQFVLYGMGFDTDYGSRPGSLTESKLAERLFAENQRAFDRARELLPMHRDLLQRVKTYGFQTI